MIKTSEHTRIILPKYVSTRPPSVLVALCVHRGIDPETWTGLNYLQKCPDINFTMTIKSGEALIDRARSIVASRFYEKKEYDILFFIDDDIVFNPLDVAKIVKEMIDLDLNIVGGAYVHKQDSKTHFVVRQFDNCQYKFGAGAPIQEVDFVSTGFLAIKRKVFDELVAAKSVPFCEEADFTFYPWFLPSLTQTDDGKWHELSEDWAFCARAKKLGFTCHIDGSVKLGHAGRYVYTWDDIFRLINGKEEIKKFDCWNKEGQFTAVRTDLPDSKELRPSMEA